MSSLTPRRSRARTLFVGLIAASLVASVVTVLDVSDAPTARATGELGILATGDDPQGIVMANGFAYITNRAEGTVTIYESEFWAFVDTITVGTGPIQINANQAETEVWVSNFDGGSISIIDTSTNLVDDTIAVGGAPQEVLFSADDSTAYALNYSLETVHVIDTATRSFTTIGTSLGLPDSGVLSADEQFLYYDGLAGMDRVYKLDLTSGDVIFDETLPFGGDKNAVFLTYSPDGTQLWVSIQENGETSVSIYNDSATELTATIPIGAGSVGHISFSPSGDLAYVSDPSNDRVTIIDTETFEIITRVTVRNQPVALATAPSGLVLVLNSLDDTVSFVGLQKERLAGANRYETAVAVSEYSFPNPTSTVFVANGLNFPDALAAGPAAGYLDGSLLLTSPTSLPDVVRDEIIRLEPDTIYVVGGTSAVSAAAFAALDAIVIPGPTQPTVVRLSGSSRYLTGAAIVEEVWDGVTVPEVFIATGRNYPDALSAGAVAAGEGIPVILVDGARATVPASTLALITALAPTQITIAGGTSVVSASIMNQLDTAFVAADVRRLAGSNRYETSAAINADAYPTSEAVILATGTNFPDALAAATLADRASSPLYLTPPNCTSAGALEGIYVGQAPYLFLLGGVSVLTPAVEALTPC